MKGGWTCRACAARVGVPFNGMASSYGYCKAGDHHVRETIRWAKDLAVDREPLTGNPVRVVAQMIEDAGGNSDRAALAHIEAHCDELVPVKPSAKRKTCDDAQGSLF